MDYYHDANECKYVICRGVASRSCNRVGDSKDVGDRGRGVYAYSNVLARLKNLHQSGIPCSLLAYAAAVSLPRHDSPTAIRTMAVVTVGTLMMYPLFCIPGV